MKKNEKISGEYAWLTMALGILTYDLVAIKTKKIETMSGALWRSLQHPVKSPFALLTWGIVTHHLFASTSARKSMILLLAAYRKVDSTIKETVA
jgi:hypothetical protein